MSQRDRGRISYHPNRELYPPIEPWSHELLDVGGGNQLYVEQNGHPGGQPIVMLHGGPGGGGGTGLRQFADPERYRIICLDQRNCGRSVPHASAPDADLSHNTTWNLVADLEKVREHLGIDRWVVFGGSWGSCLALAYAQTHPERVKGLVLRGIFTLRASELEWFYQDGASHVMPDHWEDYCAPLLAAGMDLDDDKIANYHRLLWSEDAETRLAAGRAWTTWESSTISLEYDADKVADWQDPEFALAFARIENHFFVNRGWLEEGQLIRDVDKIRHIPAVIIHGRYDMCCPMRTAWDLHRAWPEADFRSVMAGHAAPEPLITSELIEATDRFADLA